MAVTEKNMDQLTACELVPFQTAVINGADCIMAAHISLPSVTGNDTPASLSPVIIQDLLRNTLGFDGVVITDALNMGAVTNMYSPADAAVLAVLAGNDMLLTIGDFREPCLAVLNAVKDGRIPEERINESVRRIIKLKHDHGLIGEAPEPAPAAPSSN
jgi:beta-N-acetylhexosaminidase